MIQQMIREGSNSSRELYIPEQDLAQEATTQMSPEAEQVIADSRARDILYMFNRDYLYGQGRCDEYLDGVLLKWGDGDSRKHIWLSVEDGKLLLVELLIDKEKSAAAFLDLQMLIEQRGHERTEAEFRTLLERAGLQLTRILPTGPFPFQPSIIEATRKDS